MSLMVSLIELARNIRLHSLEMTSRGGSSHLGGCLSVADILAVLYGKAARHNPGNPQDPERDRIIMSKGHAAAALYAVLAESGYFPPEELLHHYQNGARFSGHVLHKGIPGVEVSSGSLGHGLALGAGMALAAKLDKASHWRVFTILSDGECDEGSIWEAALFAGHHKLSKLWALIDYNKIQSLGSVTEVLELEPFAAKWSSFGWEVREVDGHNVEALSQALDQSKHATDKPTCLLCHTVKGKGVSFMEHQLLWHYRTAKGTEYDQARKELESVPAPRSVQ